MIEKEKILQPQTVWEPQRSGKTQVKDQKIKMLSRILATGSSSNLRDLING